MILAEGIDGQETQKQENELPTKVQTWVRHKTARLNQREASFASSL